MWRLGVLSDDRKFFNVLDFITCNFCECLYFRNTRTYFERVQLLDVTCLNKVLYCLVQITRLNKVKRMRNTIGWSPLSSLIKSTSNVRYNSCFNSFNFFAQLVSPWSIVTILGYLVYIPPMRAIIHIFQKGFQGEINHLRY